MTTTITDEQVKAEDKARYDARMSILKRIEQQTDPKLGSLADQLTTIQGLAQAYQILVYSVPQEKKK